MMGAFSEKIVHKVVFLTLWISGCTTKNVIIYVTLDLYNPVVPRIENSRAWAWYQQDIVNNRKMVICVSNHIEIYMIRASS